MKKITLQCDECGSEENVKRVEMMFRFYIQSKYKSAKSCGKKDLCGKCREEKITKFIKLFVSKSYYG
ncbi:MAG: hypothetical protein ACYCS1_05045 [Gammaproteobacteria bacterium]